jgi:hypothetical protein
MSAISEIEAFVYCCDYDCWERLELDKDLYYQDGFVYCNERCAANHYYDRKKEVRRTFNSAIASQKVFADAIKYARNSVKESVAAYQEYKAECMTAIAAAPVAPEVAPATTETKTSE